MNRHGFASAGQLALIAGALRREGYRRRDQRLDRLEVMTGRPLDSSAQLTLTEAGRVLAAARRCGSLRTRANRPTGGKAA